MKVATDPATCPVSGCNYGEEEPRNFAQVASHVNNTEDAAHRRAADERDWSYTLSAD